MRFLPGLQVLASATLVTSRPMQASPERHSIVGEVFRRLAEQKESRIEEGRPIPGPAHMLIAIPPKDAVVQVSGYIKGKGAIHLVRVCEERKRSFVGQHFARPDISCRR